MTPAHWCKLLLPHCDVIPVLLHGSTYNVAVHSVRTMIYGCFDFSYTDGLRLRMREMSDVINANTRAICTGHADGYQLVYETALFTPDDANLV